MAANANGESTTSLESVIPALYVRLGLIERGMANRYFRSHIAQVKNHGGAAQALARTSVNVGVRTAVMPLGFVVGGAIILMLATAAREPWLVVGILVLSFCIVGYAKAFLTLRQCYRYFAPRAVQP